MTETVVYRLFDESGTLLYVGMSSFLGQRLSVHKKLSPWFHLVRSKEVISYPSREDASAAETDAIQSGKPIYNRQQRSHAVYLNPNSRRHGRTALFSDTEMALVEAAATDAGKLASVYIRDAAVAKAKRAPHRGE